VKWWPRRYRPTSPANLPTQTPDCRWNTRRARTPATRTARARGRGYHHRWGCAGTAACAAKKHRARYTTVGRVQTRARCCAEVRGRGRSKNAWPGAWARGPVRRTARQAMKYAGSGSTQDRGGPNTEVPTSASKDAKSPKTRPSASRSSVRLLQPLPPQSLNSSKPGVRSRSAANAHSSLGHSFGASHSVSSVNRQASVVSPSTPVPPEVTVASVVSPCEPLPHDRQRNAAPPRMTAGRRRSPVAVRARVDPQDLDRAGHGAVH
jgi:hypothetical protein